MKGEAAIRTARLLLRPPSPGDAEAVRRLAGDARIAETTLEIPHPYGLDDAREWIASQADEWRRGTAASFVVVVTATGELVGAVGLKLDRRNDRGELGYWVGVPYWGRGYATEAARAAVDYGFRDLDLNRIEAHHMARNPASGRVLEKLGMRNEGRLRQYFKKRGVFEDVWMYSLLREEWRS